MATEPREAALGAGEEVASGMPQLDPSSYPNQIFWLIVALIAIYFVLSRVALPRISSVLAERQGTITNDIAAAEELKQKATEAERAYDKALADARSEANRITEENKAKMQSELDRATEKAEAEIAAQQVESEKRITEIRDNAMASVEEVAKDTALAVVNAMGFEGDRDQVDSAVDKRLKGAA
ncbi:F0F1 ATP synthase subunit B' [Palleronia sp. LCG004]|uniref:F0F1 ATP synthase subunit B' n=1 Tax=Palleronia sp. LCG004 TaxID=3079304 RepID=UPI0029420E89|nr:F0F1 ATP synthase subunit B' [Palleronia sp. LCG004]WOI55060.1 F0F1 ATP synthase subunit B' [Palleronia sp. LCG004]